MVLIIFFTGYKLNMVPSKPHMIDDLHAKNLRFEKRNKEDFPQNSIFFGIINFIN